MTSLVLDDVERLVEDMAAGDATERETLAILRARRLTPDRTALADAVTLLWLRNQFIDGDGDAYDFLGVEPRAGVRFWDAAVMKCEDDLRQALLVLAKPLLHAVAS